MVFRNFTDMPVPDFAYTDRHDGRVFIKNYDENGKEHKLTIGYMTDDTKGKEKMIPNAHFRDKYPNIWKENYPDKPIPAHQKSVGMYILTLGIVVKTKVYDILKNIYGPMYANNILDYVMFLIMYKSSATELFENIMEDEVLFSKKLYSDSWYSKFFAKNITEDQHHEFRIQIIKQLKASNKITKVWIAIDGSNNDCEARQSFLAKYGFPKSHNKNKTIVRYMYAVNAEDGRPVTYFTYNGSVPDCKAFQKMAVFLKSFDIEIEGVILDRGFAVEEVFKTIEEFKWKYVIMITTDTNGHKNMVEKHRTDIALKSACLVDDHTLYGMCDKVKLFASHTRISNVALFYSYNSAEKQTDCLNNKIVKAITKAERSIAAGNKATIEKSLRKYIEIAGEGSERKIIVHHNIWDQAVERKGYFSIAASDGLTAKEINSIYKMRDTSETQFSIIKSHEGGNTTRVYTSEGIFSKFFLTFLASLLRFEIEETCKKFGLDTNPFIAELDEVVLVRSAEDKYESANNLTLEQEKIFAEFDLDQNSINQVAVEYNSRVSKSFSNPDRASYMRIKAPEKKNSGKVGRPPKKDKITDSKPDQSKPKSKGGRPKGSSDTKPRKPRSDKGKKRVKRTNN